MLQKQITLNTLHCRQNTSATTRGYIHECGLFAAANCGKSLAIWTDIMNREKESGEIQRERERKNEERLERKKKSAEDNTLDSI